MKLRKTLLGRLYLRWLIHSRNTSLNYLVIRYRKEDADYPLRIIKRYNKKGIKYFKLITVEF